MSSAAGEELANFNCICTDSCVKNSGLPSALAKWRGPRNTPIDIRPHSEVDLASKQLLASLGQRLDGDNGYARWYINDLKAKINEISPDIIKGVQPESSTRNENEQNGGKCPCHENILMAMKALTCSAAMLKEEPNLALNQVKNELIKMGVLNSETRNDSAAKQFIFILFGLLTFLYDPVLSPAADLLQIRFTSSGSRADTWIQKQLDVGDQVVEYPLPSLLDSFGGNHRPIPFSVLSEQQLEPFHYQMRLAPLSSANLNYYTLRHIACLGIIWTSSACEHLELNARQRTIKLFRYPSFCGLVCTSLVAPPDPKTFAHNNQFKPYLNRFFQDYAGSNHDAPLDRRLFDTTGPTQCFEDAAQFYKEIIQSFRILFGQHGRSRSLFEKSIMADDQLEEVKMDPLLYTLCTKDWTTQVIYSDVSATPVKTTYLSHVDFFFFAERLTVLQEFVLTQKPRGWVALWRDKRDLNIFWTFWAVIIFGFITIFLTCGQIIIGILQIVLQGKDGSE